MERSRDKRSKLRFTVPRNKEQEKADMVAATTPRNLLKLPKASVNVQKRIHFPLDAQAEMAFIIEIMPNFQHKQL